METNKYLINHKRFKKKFEEKDLKKYNQNRWRVFEFPETVYAYYKFFEDYAKKNYELKKLDCLCKKENSILLSKTDRHCHNFLVVVCKECGLIRADKMYTTDNLEDFYKNYYRETTRDTKTKITEPSEFYAGQATKGINVFKLINKYSPTIINKDTSIVDIGGGAGGILENFKPLKNLYLADYFKPYQEIAKKNGIKIINGGSDKVDFKPDIIILSHVVEHWSEFEIEIKRLIKLQKINKTLNYIEFPGIDSLKDGRRGGDILGDFHVPHVFYFSSYVFENIMNMNGFHKIYIDSHVRSLFIYTGVKGEFKNYFEKTYQDLILAEKTRKFYALKRIIRKILPNAFVELLKKLIF